MTELQRQWADWLVATGLVNAYDDGHPDGPDFRLTGQGYNVFKMLKPFIEREDSDFKSHD